MDNKEIKEIFIQRFKLLALSEIKDAILADKKNRKFPAMRRVGILLRDKSLFDVFSSEEIYELADFVEGKHRGKKGKKNDEQFNKEVDLERFGLFLGYLEETKSRVAALEMLIDHEKLDDIRSAERSVARAIKHHDELIQKRGGKVSVKEKYSEMLKELKKKKGQDDGT